MKSCIFAWKEEKTLNRGQILNHTFLCIKLCCWKTLNTLFMTNYQSSIISTTFVCTPLVFEHQAKMFVRQGVDSEHLKVCPHDQKYYALEPIDTDQFFFFCDSKSSESDSILGSYYAKRYTRLPTTHLVFRSFGAWITITSSTFFHHTFPSS